MIVKLKKGKSARGVTQYVLNKEKAQLLDTNMLGQNPSQLSKEFGVSRLHRPALKTGVVHAMLSVPADEKLTDAQWKEIANNFRKEMGFTDSQYVIARHHDSDNDHVHLVLSRVQFNGDVVSDSWDYVKAEQIARKLEQQYSLSPQNSSWEVRRERRQQELSRIISDRISEDILARAYAEAFEHPDNFLDLKTGRFMAAEDIYNYYKSLGFEPGEEVWINARSPEGKPQIFQGRLGENGIAELWKMRSTGKDADGLTIWQPESAIAQPEKHLREIARTGHDLSTYPNHPVGGIGGKHAAQFNTLFYEIDDLPIEQQQQKLKELEIQTGLTPTAVVHSGGKSLHAYYRLDEPVDRDTWLRLQRKLTALQNGDAAIPNPGRAMRLPGVDRLRDGLLKSVEIVEKSDRTFSPTGFEQALDQSLPYGLSEARWQQWRKTKDTAILTKPEEELVSRYEPRPPTTFDYKVSGRIPLDILLTRDDQELLRVGSLQGGRDNLAFKLARNAIATQRQLEQMGVNYDGDPRALLEEFAQRCDPPLKQQDVERILNSASRGNPVPSRSVESLEKAIAYWERELQRQKESQEFSLPPSQKTVGEEQAEAIAFLNNFYSGDDQFALLKGRPGTGKTHVANQFLGQLPAEKKVAFLAPTNQVREMLAQSGNPNVDYLTIHQFLGMKPIQGETDLEFTQTGNSKSADYDLVLVDESSMIDQQLWEKFKEKAPRKTLFLGDDKQLKPVKDRDISPVFREIPVSYELTKPVRYEQEIGEFVEQLRNAIATGDLPQPSANLSPEGKGISTPDNQNWLEQLVTAAKSEEFKLNPNYAKALAFKNETVDAINQYVHESIYGKDAPIFAPGERFVAKRPVSRKLDNGKRGVVLRNSQMGEVVAATPSQFKLRNHELRTWTLDARDINNPEKIVKLNVLDPNSAPLVSQELERIKGLASQLPKGSNERKAAFEEYRQLRARFDEIAHPYATTIHKAQGLSIDNAFVDWADLEKNPNPSERAALANVAASRAKKHLSINTQGFVTPIVETEGLSKNTQISSHPDMGKEQSPITNQPLPTTKTQEEKSVENLGQIEAYENYGSPEIRRDLRYLSNQIDINRRNLQAQNLTSQLGWWNKFLNRFPLGRNVNSWLEDHRDRRFEKFEAQAMKKYADEKRRMEETQRKVIDREMRQVQRAIGVMDKRIPQIEENKAFKEQFYDVMKHYNTLIEYEQKLEAASQEIDNNIDTLRKQILESPYKEHFERFESYQKFLKEQPTASKLVEKVSQSHVEPTAKTLEDSQPKLPKIPEFEGKLPPPEKPVADLSKTAQPEQQLPEKPVVEPPKLEQEAEEKLSQKQIEKDQPESKIPVPEFPNLEFKNDEELNISQRQLYRYPKDHPDVLSGERRAGSFMKKDKWQEWFQQQSNTPVEAVPEAVDLKHSGNGATKLSQEQQKQLMEDLGRTNLNNPFLDDIIDDENEQLEEQPTPEQVARLQEQLNFDQSLPELSEVKAQESAFDKPEAIEPQQQAVVSAFDQTPDVQQPQIEQESVFDRTPEPQQPQVEPESVFDFDGAEHSVESDRTIGISPAPTKQRSRGLER